MTSRGLNALQLFLLAQWRRRFPHVYLGMALVTVLAFRLAIPEQYAESLVPAFLLAEPGTLALTLVAAQAYLERGERSVTAPLQEVLAQPGRAAAVAIRAVGRIDCPA